MNAWRGFLRLTVTAATLLIAALVLPSAAQAHAGHAGGHVTRVHALAGGTQAAPAIAVVAAAIETIEAGRDVPRDRLHGSCGGPCCNVACNPGCSSHALSSAIAALPPALVVLARLAAPRVAPPSDPPERRLPKPPRA